MLWMKMFALTDAEPESTDIGEILVKVRTSTLYNCF